MFTLSFSSPEMFRNTLAKIHAIDPQTDQYGKAFEHFIAMELRAYVSYRRLHQSLSYWRTQQGHEVDFIIGDDVAIEVKATEKVQNKHLKGLRYLAEEQICQHHILVSQDSTPQRVDNIDILPWQEFLTRLWRGEWVGNTPIFKGVIK